MTDRRNVTSITFTYHIYDLDGRVAAIFAAAKTLPHLSIGNQLSLKVDGDQRISACVIRDVRLNMTHQMDGALQYVVDVYCGEGS